ncbi:MAG: phosphate/phosphite/phosphonate ABC transporter substrate-binding protein [Acetobacteraceae bacterium]|nr:phosphate/phosphite/phosphonate ABC transporter substrate-binding protein [Acetobacteraceae bacterium]MSP30737.1 phosphate/phosphite/phosphonate ABC transporter substrate-binding protein [Acetobacteraceae bacterium]
MTIARRDLLTTLTLATLPALAHAQAMPKPGKRDWAAQFPVLRIGMLGGENDADRLARYGGYRKLLETTFEMPIKLVVAADYAGAIQAFAAKHIELAYMSPSAYASAWTQSDGDVLPILVTQEQDGSTAYVAAMYTRADSGITNLADMKGRALAWSDPNSASGYLIPRAEFRAAGIDPEPKRYFARTGFAGGHEQAVVAVLNRQYDAGVAWISGIGDPAGGYSRGVFRMMVDKKMINMTDLRVIWTSRPILNGPIVLRRSTPKGFQDDMFAFHLALPLAHPDIYHAIDMGSGKRWVPVTHEDYVVFIDMLKQEAAERRRR